eukprot:scaffold35789_cov90-Isochrysis_galbana.AAC.1
MPFSGSRALRGFLPSPPLCSGQAPRSPRVCQLRHALPAPPGCRGRRRRRPRRHLCAGGLRNPAGDGRATGHRTAAVAAGRRIPAV